MAHHPEKFLDGRMLWHGRIYSPLPFVRSLWGERVNAGVWGTAAFPSVYRADVHPFAFLPHSVKWQMISLALVLAGVIVNLTSELAWAAGLLLGAGGVGLAATIAEEHFLRAAIQTCDALPGSRLWYRAAVAYLHFIQPFARIAGQIRGILSPPQVALPVAQRADEPRSAPDAAAKSWRALLLLHGRRGRGSVLERRLDERGAGPVAAHRLAATLARRPRHRDRRRVVARSRRQRAGRADGRGSTCARSSRSTAAARALLRVGTHLRPTTLGVLGARALAGRSSRRRSPASRCAGRSPASPPRSRPRSSPRFGVWRTAQTTAILRRGVGAVTQRLGMTPLRAGPATVPLVAPSMLRTYGLRSATVFVVMIARARRGHVHAARSGLGAGDRRAAPATAATTGRRSKRRSTRRAGSRSRPAGDVYFADSNNHVIRRIDARNNISTVAGDNARGAGFSAATLARPPPAQLDTPERCGDRARRRPGVADSHNHRIRRVDRETGVIITIAGHRRSRLSTATTSRRPRRPLHTPNAVAAAPNGDIYIADTLNYRIRMIDHATGLIHTVAGVGVPGDSGTVGDGGPATEAFLNMPSDVVIGPTGDIYIADMHHQRVRRIDARTRLIYTVAGTGQWGYAGDGGPATDALLAGPAGLAVVPEPDGGVTIYIADYYNGHVRAVGPDGIIRDISDDGRMTLRHADARRVCGDSAGRSRSPTRAATG